MSKITITPIGTCRINTPLKRGAARYPVQLELQRVYGFIHSSEEAVQQLRYMRGEKDLPSQVLPVLFRPGLALDDEPPVEKAADLTIVEISSGKAYRAGDVPVQSNYLVRHFADFFASTPRTRTFWELARRDRDGLRSFLESDPVYNLYDEADRALLGSLTLHLQTFDEILADMTTIVEMLGRERTLFVTHVNATGADGAVIPSRDKLIRWVKMAAQRLGTECFDPTQLMRDFGQERAMEDGGLDLTHFTNPFADRWYSRVQRDYVMARLGDAGFEGAGAASPEVAMKAESIAETMAYDDFFGGSRELFGALKAHPGHAALQLLHGQVLCRIGDYEGARACLSPHAEAPEMTPEARQSLMRALFETGEAAAALDIAGQLMSDEYENMEIFEVAGLAADRLGLAEDAARYRKIAFRHDPSHHANAVSVLDYYLATGEGEQFGSWLREVLDQLESTGDASLARGMADWALARRNDEGLSRSLVVLAASDMARVLTLVEEAARTDMHLALAAAIQKIAAMPALTDKVARAFRIIAKEWAQQCEAMLAEGKAEDAYAIAAACLAVLPRNSSARRVERAVLDVLRAEVREARMRHDDHAVLVLCSAAGDMVYQRRDVASAFATALLRENRLAEAQAVARRVYEATPEQIDARASYAHIAGANDDIATALALYGDLASESAEETERYRVRIDRFLGVAGRKGVRKVRELLADGRYEDAIALCRLIERYTDEKDRAANELQRVRGVLRQRLRQLDEEDERSDEPLRLLQLMLSIVPQDASVLRRAALEAMKQQDFELAIGFWRGLDEVSPGLESTTRNLNRCEVMANRQSRQARAGGAQPSLVA